MPVPGPRTQQRPDPGYRNPENRRPDFFNHWERPGPVWWPGRTPGTMVMNLRGNVLAPGQIRRLWRQAIDLIPAQSAFSWTNSDISQTGGRPLDITRALRYMTRSVYMRGGEDSTRFLGSHTQVTQAATGMAGPDKQGGRVRGTKGIVTVGGGQKRYAPTIRNRLTSFGSRVNPLNQQVGAAEGQSPGRATQA